MAKCGRCRRCRAEVIWAVLPSGRSIPLDYRELPDGDLFVLAAGDVAIVVKEVQRVEMRLEGRRLYAPHRRWCTDQERRSA